MQKIIFTNDQYKELWSLLGLFESKAYVKDKLKSKYPSISEDEADLRTERVVYSVRQAREFYVSSGFLYLRIISSMPSD